MTTAVPFKVADIMSRQVLVAHPKHEFLPLCRLFLLMNIHHLPVVEENGELIGMLSANDVLRAFSFKLPEMKELSEHALNEKFSVLDLMTSQPIHTISPDAPVAKAIHLFANQHINSLPVVEHNQVVGIITTRDIVRFLDKTNADGIQATA